MTSYRDCPKYGKWGFKIKILSRWRLCGKALSAALRGLKAQQVQSPGQRPGYHVPHSLRPVRAKVKINRSLILLPLQGVGVYTLIPMALPWAANWLPFQGAPSRALFVYHVRMLRHVLFSPKSRRDFSGFYPPPLHPSQKTIDVGLQCFIVHIVQEEIAQLRLFAFWHLQGNPCACLFCRHVVAHHDAF